MDLLEPATALDEIVESAKSSRETSNEAETRLLVIDRVLERVLGWPLDQFHPEQYGGTSTTGKKAWLDYHLGDDDSPRIVVEAKRSPKTFQLGAGTQRQIPLRDLRVHYGEELKKALNQAESYCRQVGTPAFIVTNGYQWVASLVFLPGLPESSLTAVVFRDLEDVKNHLREFIDLFSPRGLAEQTLVHRAGGGTPVVPSFSRSLNDALYGGMPDARNYLSASLRLLMRECFGELTRDDQVDMLDECYVTTDASGQHLRLLETFVHNVSPDYVPIGSSTIQRDDMGTRQFAESVAVGMSALIVGRAGSGKSTFLAKLRRDLARVSNSNNVILYVDLRVRTETHSHNFDHDVMVDDVCRDLLIEAREKYRRLDPFERTNLEEIFEGEISRLRTMQRETARSGPEFDAKVDEIIEKHVAKSVWHLKAFLGFLNHKHVPAILLLDNVDRGTSEFEMVISKLADQLSTNTNTTIAICMRETTYKRGTIGFLDVRRQNVLKISPPPFDQVATKRFSYTAKRLSSDQKLSRRLTATLGGAPLSRVLDFANMMSELVLGDEADLRDCIGALSGTNIRKALRILEEFAVSPHTDPDAIFKQYQRSSRDRYAAGLALEVFLRSVMRGEERRYREHAGGIVNLFQASRSRRSSHFTAIRILQLLDWRMRQPRGDADITVAELVGNLGRLGYPASEVMLSLQHLGKEQLVGSLSNPEPEWDEVDTIRLGTAGRYYLTTLIYNLEYLFNIADDTVIYDKATFDALELVETGKGKAWADKRDQKVRLFLAYLARVEAEEAPLTKLGSRPPWLSFVAREIGIKRFGRSFDEMIKPHKTSRRN